MGAPAFVYVAPEGLIRCDAKSVTCGPKAKNSKKATLNGTWVFALKAQTLVADKRPVHTKKKMAREILMIHRNNKTSRHMHDDLFYLNLFCPTSHSQHLSNVDISYKVQTHA